MLRRMIGPVLIGTGIFLLVLAYCLPFVAYPRLAILPTDPQTGQIAHGTGFNVFFPRSVADGGIRQLTDVSVTSKVFVSEDDSNGRQPESSPNAHWQVATRTYVDEMGPGDKGLLQTTVEGISLDRHTALANNCCGDYMLTEQGDKAGKKLVHKGYVFMFPFGTEKKTYPVWDGTAENTFPAVYDGTEERRGYRTYRFEQNVPDTETGTQDLPGQYFGVKDPSVTATYLYRTHRTYWIEPHSGGIIDYQEDMDRRFTYNGITIPVIQGTLHLVPPSADDATQKLLKKAAMGLPLLRWRLPMLFLPLGLVLIAIGVVRVRRQHRAEQEDWDDDYDDEYDDEDDEYEDDEPRQAGVNSLFRSRS